MTVKVKVVRTRDNRTVRFSAEAPAGNVWRANDAHEVTSWCYTGDKSWEKQARADLDEDVKAGYYPCPDGKDCEWEGCAKARKIEEGR
jgi:hypothetical protein